MKTGPVLFKIAKVIENKEESPLVRVKRTLR